MNNRKMIAKGWVNVNGEWYAPVVKSGFKVGDKVHVEDPDSYVNDDGIIVAVEGTNGYKVRLSSGQVESFHWTDLEKA